MGLSRVFKSKKATVSSTLPDERPPIYRTPSWEDALPSHPTPPEPMPARQSCCCGTAHCIVHGTVPAPRAARTQQTPTVTPTTSPAHSEGSQTQPRSTAFSKSDATSPSRPQLQRSNTASTFLSSRHNIATEEDYFSYRPRHQQRHITPPLRDDFAVATPEGENLPLTPPPAYEELESPTSMPGSFSQMATDFINNINPSRPEPQTSSHQQSEYMIDLGNVASGLLGMAGNFISSVATSALESYTQPQQKASTTIRKPARSPRSQPVWSSISEQLAQPRAQAQARAPFCIQVSPNAAMSRAQSQKYGGLQRSESRWKKTLTKMAM